jgi:WD40 repeat protein
MRSTSTLVAMLLGATVLSAPAPLPRRLAPPRLPYTFRTGDEVTSVAFHPTTWQVAVAGEGGAALWDLSADGEVRSTLVRGGCIKHVAYSPDGDLVALAGEKAVHLWDAKRTRRLALLPFGMGRVFRVAFSPDGRTLVACGWGGPVRSWDVATHMEGRDQPGQHMLLGLAFSPEGKTLAIGDALSSEITLCDIATWKPRLSFTSEERHWVTSLAFSPDGKALVSSGGVDNAVRLWQSATGKQLAKLEGHEKSVREVAFSHDGRLIASASEDKSVRLWDAAKHRIIRTIETKSTANALAFRRRGGCVAVGCEDGSVTLFPVDK